MELLPLNILEITREDKKDRTDNFNWGLWWGYVFYANKEDRLSFNLNYSIQDTVGNECIIVYSNEKIASGTDLLRQIIKSDLGRYLIQDIFDGSIREAE